MSDETKSPAPEAQDAPVAGISVPTAPSAPDPPSYADRAKDQREKAIAHLEILLEEMPPVSSVEQVYPQTRSDLAYAIHHLKQGRK